MLEQGLDYVVKLAKSKKQMLEWFFGFLLAQSFHALGFLPTLEFHAFVSEYDLIVKVGLQACHNLRVDRVEDLWVVGKPDQ